MIAIMCFYTKEELGNKVDVGTHEMLAMTCLHREECVKQFILDGITSSIFPKDVVNKVINGSKKKSANSVVDIIIREHNDSIGDDGNTSITEMLEFNYTLTEIIGLDVEHLVTEGKRKERYLRFRKKSVRK